MSPLFRPAASALTLRRRHCGWLGQPWQGAGPGGGVHRCAGGGRRLGRKASAKTSRPSAELTDVLVAHRDKYANDDWLFPSADGGPIRASNFRKRVWIPATDAAGLAPPSLRFHDLRHTHATLLIDQGEPVLVIQKRLGHSRPSITLDTYGHLFGGVDEAAADKLTLGLK